MTHTILEPTKSNSSAAVTSIHRFLKLDDVVAITTLSKSEIYRRISSNTFPKQISLGPKSVVWIESEVLIWCEERIAASRCVAA